MPQVAERQDDKAGSQTMRAQLALRELVMSGEMRPGERLSELAIVERIGVSRTPVRAALMTLADEGLVEHMPFGGFTVRSFNEVEVSDAIAVRGAVEGLAVRLAAERGVSPMSLASLRDLLRQLDEAVALVVADSDDFEAYVDLNARFHREIVGLADSRVIERQLERVMTLPFASPSAFLLAQAQSPQARQILIVAQDQHHCIVEAIERREGARAEALMCEHSRLATRNLANALRSRKVLDLVPGAALIHLRGE